MCGGGGRVCVCLGGWVLGGVRVCMCEHFFPLKLWTPCFTILQVDIDSVCVCVHACMNVSVYIYVQRNCFWGEVMGEVSVHLWTQ